MSIKRGKALIVGDVVHRRFKVVGESEVDGHRYLETLELDAYETEQSIVSWAPAPGRDYEVESSSKR